MRFEFLVDDIFLLNFSLCIEEYILSLRIWELKFEILLSDTFLLQSLGHKKIWYLRFEILLIVWLVVSSYEECRYFGPTENMLSIIIWELRIEFLLIMWLVVSSYHYMKNASIFGPIENMLSIIIWELRFEFLVGDIFLFNLYLVHWRFGNS